MSYRGFTLIELVAVIAILGVVSLALTSAITYFYKSNRVVLQSIAAANTVRAASTDFVQNVREAGYGDDGSYPLAGAASSTLTFFANTDSDASLEKVRWYVNNGTLYKGVTKFTEGSYDFIEKKKALFPFLQTSTTTPLFQYFDEEGSALAEPIDVTKVRSIMMNVTVAGSAATTSIFSLSSRAAFRLFSR